MSFNYKNPITPLSTLGNISVQRQNVFGTNFSILSTGGYMEVYNINELYYTIPPSTTGLIEYSGNSIPIQLNKGTGSPFSFDVLTLNSDNISSGRRRLGMLVYVIDEDQIYQYQIPNFTSLWNSATGATGPGGNTVVFSDFGTTVKGNTPEGLSFISAWTSNIIEGVSGGTSVNSVWKKLVTGGGGTFTGGTVTGNTIFTSGLTANTFSASTYLGLPGDIFITGGTFDTNTDTLTLDRNSGSSITITGFTDYYTTAFTYNDNTFTIYDNSGNTFPVTVNDFTGLTINGSLSATTYLGLPIDVYVTGGTYSAGTTTFTNNTGGTFNVTGFTTPFTGNTSGDCITDLFVSNVNSCSPLHIQPTSIGDVLIGENGGVNVGIGTSTPTAKLEIKGNDSSSSNFGIKVQDSGGTDNFVVRNDGNVYVNAIFTPSYPDTNIKTYINTGQWVRRLYVDSDIRNHTSNIDNNSIRIGENGGIGFWAENTSPLDGEYNYGGTIYSTNKTLNVRGGINGLNLLGGQSGTLGLNVALDGKVGVNTSNPSEVFEVSGKTKTTNFQMTSGATNGYILTSDGSGNASWQAVASPSATTISIDPVLSITSTPPMSPNDGDRYLVSSASTGDFSGQTNNIAEWDGSVWTFYVPSTDDIVYVSGVLLTYRFNGSLLSSFKWEVYGFGVAILQNGNTFNGPMFIGTNDNQIVNIKSSGGTRMFISPSNGVTIGRNQSLNPSNVFLKIGGTNGQSNISTGGDGFITFGKIGTTKQWGFSLNSVGAALTTTNATMYAGSVGVNTTPSHGLGTVINAVGTTTRGNLDFTNLGNLNARFFPDSISFSPLPSNGLSIIGGSVNTTRNSFVFTSPTSINLNPSTELIGADFNFSNAIGHQGGNIPLQRDFVLRNRRHNYNSASTINESYTMWIGGAPIVGTNANILENWALGVGGDTNITGKTKTINFQMTSGATNGYILTSDGSGNASWSPLSGTTGYSSTYSAGILLNSSGWTSTGTGQINLPQVQVALFNNPNFIEPVSVYTISSGTTGVLSIPSLQDNDTNYIVIEYNGGSPRYNVLNNDGTINDSDVVLYLIVYRAGNFIHVLDFGNQGAGLPNKLNDRVIMTDRFARESGFSLGLSGSTGVVTLTSGVAWNGTNRQTLTGVNSQDDIFFKNFHSGGTWVYTTTGNTLNNEYYDDGTNPVLATTGKYLVNWYFRGQEVNDHLYEVYGTDEYDSVSEAQLSVEPTLPELITSHAFLTGRIIVQVSATTGYVESAFVRVFQSTTVTEHNDLLGLQGGLGGQYYHLNSNQYNNLPLLNSNNVFQSGLTANTISSTTINTVSLGTSANCITDLFVNNINSCSPLHIQPINLGDVYIGENGGVNVGIGTLSPTEKLFVSGNTYITGGSSSFLVGNSQPYLARNLTNDFIQLNNDGFGQSVFASPSAITLSVGPVVGNGLKVINTNNLVGNLLSYNFADYLFKSYYSGSTNYFEINHTGFNGDNKFGVNTIPTATIHAKGVDSSSSNFGLKVQDSGGTDNFVVRNDGNVGVGLSNPTYKLDVRGNTYIKSDNPIVYSYLKFDPDNTGDHNFILGYTAGYQSSFQVRGNSDVYLTDKSYQSSPNFYLESMSAKMRLQQFHSDTYLYLGGVGTGTSFNFVTSGSTNLMTIKGDGNIGIGTSTPTAKLQIKFNDLSTGNTVSPFSVVDAFSQNIFYLSNQNYYGDPNRIGFYSYIYDNQFSIDLAGSAGQFKLTRGVNKFWMRPYPNALDINLLVESSIGGGGGAEAGIRHVFTGTSTYGTIYGESLYIGTDSSTGSTTIVGKFIGKQGFSNPNATFYPLIALDGNVGIGTSSPSETLDINGKTKTTNFQMTSGATNGYILTSDGSGNASWSPQSGITGSTNTYVTGVTYSANTLTVSQNNGVIPINTTIGLNIKSNTVTAASFTGTPLTYTVIFTTPYPSTNYTITITGSDNRVFTYESKTINGFVINTNANTILTGNVDWQTISIGES